LAEWRAQGLNVQWVDLIVSGTNGSGKGTPESARAWMEKFKFTTVNVVADPQYQLIKPGMTSIGTPSFIIVDPRTMKVVKWQEGVAPDSAPGNQHSVIENLAKKNRDLAAGIGQ
jgi:hypothetical protein